MTALTREQLLASTYPPPQRVEVDGLGEVYVRVISGAERDRWEQQVETEHKRGPVANVMGRFLSLAIADATGARLFTDADAETIGAWPHHWLRRMFDAALSHNAMHPADVQVLEKN